MNAALIHKICKNLDLTYKTHYTVSDDNLYRGNIYFNITINPSSLPNNVIVGDTGQNRVIILHVDDDSKLITYHILHCNESKNICHDLLLTTV